MPDLAFSRSAPATATYRVHPRVPACPRPAATQRPPLRSPGRVRSKLIVTLAALESEKLIWVPIRPRLPFVAKGAPAWNRDGLRVNPLSPGPDGVTPAPPGVTPPGAVVKSTGALVLEPSAFEPTSVYR
jgi:hypothetical protein